MAQLKLTANTPSEQRILEYLQNNASETLAEKINNGTPFEKDGKPLTNKKSLSGFMKYACGEARNLTAKDETAACVEDSVVYGWAIHYFEEDSIEGTLYTLDGSEYANVGGRWSLLFGGYAFIVLNVALLVLLFVISTKTKRISKQMKAQALEASADESEIKV